ncbi:hypothetical protein WIS52_04355 [Pseudonocardia nematodicida]|uniref:TPR-repeat-containing protein n=1 Tax=Pseudonocardia nematodicida TaxID=1206997 RepID=A0ABV1K6C0_9PSEU
MVTGETGEQPAAEVTAAPAVDDRDRGHAPAEGDGRRTEDRPRETTNRVEPRPRRDEPRRDDRPRRDRDGRGDRPSGRRDDRPSRGRDDRPFRGRDDRDRGRPARDDRERPRRVVEAAHQPYVDEPQLPDSISPSELDPGVRRDLRGLQKETAELVARHLVAAGVLVDDDPALALAHARYARRRASRIAVVREAAGIVAYHAGEWNEALGEFRAARRMGGGPGHVHVMADIERALGRPERALDLARSPEARDLGDEERIELLIVAAGARRDLGERDAAVVGLQIPELEPRRRDPWSARLFYAYADNLFAAGREADAVQWFVHAHDADTEQQTDAAERIAEITGEELPGTGDDGVRIGYEDVPAQVAGTVPAGGAGDVLDRGGADRTEGAPVAPEAVEGADTGGADTRDADAGVTGTVADAGTVPDDTDEADVTGIDATEQPETAPATGPAAAAAGTTAAADTAGPGEAGAAAERPEPTEATGAEEKDGPERP